MSLKRDVNQIWPIGVAALTVLLVGVMFAMFRQSSEVQHLTLAAGSRTGESYILSTALRTVVEHHYPHIKIDVVETGGTAENLRLMEDGRAQLAVAQADVAAGPSARILAILYDDTFQLLTKRDSAIRTFSDLGGRTIGLAKRGGQFQSFLRVAAHFGLQESDFRFVGADDASADRAFEEGRAEAIFRVRALSNPSIQRLVKTGNFRFVRIDHAAAMKINHPAFEPAIIPAGAYLGNPAIPTEDLPSISVHRTLLAASSVSSETTRAVTGTLIDWRQEIAQQIPEEVAPVRLLLSQARRPDQQAELGPPLHPGALSFYEKDKPPFILAHADYLGLLLTIFVMVSSWIWQLRAWLEKRQKRVADEYSNQVVALINEAREAKSHTSLQRVRNQLLGILVAAVGDLDKDTFRRIFPFIPGHSADWIGSCQGQFGGTECGNGRPRNATGRSRWKLAENR